VAELHANDKPLAGFAATDDFMLERLRAFVTDKAPTDEERERFTDGVRNSTQAALEWLDMVTSLRSELHKESKG
jgi:hypothetical protein